MKLKDFMVEISFILLLVLFFSAFQFAHMVIDQIDNTESSQELKAQKIAESEEILNSYTIGDLRIEVENNGVGICEKILDENVRTSCMEYYWDTIAEKEENPKLCEKVEYPGFERQCKLKAAAVAVAKEYYYKVQETGDENYVPKKIKLCNQLKYEDDIKKCMDPKKVLEHNYFEVVYKIEAEKSGSGDINQ